MKKMLKKAMSVLLAVSVIMAYSVTCFAATNDGSITIDNSTSGATYNAYKIFDLTYSQPEGTTSDEDKNVAYSYTASGNDDAFLGLLKGSNSPFDVTATQVTNQYAITPKANADDSAIIAWLTENAPRTTAAATGTGNGGALEFNDLAYGYYLITSTVKNSDGDTTGKSVVTIDSTLKDVTVVDKNQGPVWDNDPTDPFDPSSEDPDNPSDNNDPGKVITAKNGTAYASGTVENTAKMGDKISFSAGIAMTKYDGTEKINEVLIADKLGEGFKDLSNIKVYIGNNEITTGFMKAVDENTFNIRFNPADVFENGNVPTNYNVKVTYDAIVDTDCVIGATGNLNTANFTWGTEAKSLPEQPTVKDPDSDEDVPTPFDPDGTDPDDGTDNPLVPDNAKTTKTYVAAIAIEKRDGESTSDPKALLDGAEFDFGLDVVYVEDGVYRLATSDDKDADKTKHVIPKGGQLVIEGLDLGTYTLQEVVAPKGYSLPKDAIEITIAAGEDDASTTDINEATVYAPTVGTVLETEVAADQDVLNYPGKELPATGGIGTTIFYILGALLVVGAAIMLITRRRMSEE